MVRNRTVNRLKLLFVLSISVFGASALALAGLRSRQDHLDEVRNWTATHSTLAVKTTSPNTGDVEQFIDLPGHLAAFNQATIYARVAGYVSAWNADIGAKVEAGQVLAEIDAPELAQQLLRARAELLSAQATAKLSEATYQRRQSLAASQVVSKQELDERLADRDLKVAAVAAVQADVRRLETQTMYTHIVAPFSGVVTSRNVNLGNLVDAGVREGSVLFSISDVSRMRVYIDVPYTYAGLIEAGSPATFTTPSDPGHVYAASVDSMSGAINTTTGTTRVQLILENADRRLMPGGYVNVRISLSRRRDILSIPADTLIVNRDGTQVAVLAPESRVALRKVKIVRDLGREILIESKLSMNDRLVVSPRDGIVDGETVRDVTESLKPR